MQDRLGKEDFADLRRSLNEMIPHAKNLLSECKTSLILLYVPPPMTGRAPEQYDGLDMITNNTSDIDLRKETVFDAIDRAIGFLKEGPKPLEAKTIVTQGRHVFVSHSSQDATVVSAVREAFKDTNLTPYFLEEKPTGVPPSREIARKVSESEALFVFFSYNSTVGTTRDWIVFELGAAVACNKDVYSWKHNSLSKELLPRMLEQVSTYRDFETTGDGAIKLISEIKSAAKALGGASASQP
jgi:hypothetical protein